MILFGLIFLTILMVCFGIVTVILRPTHDQSTTNRRMAAIIASQVESGEARRAMEEQLLVAGSGPFGWLEDLLEKTTLLRGLKRLLLQGQNSWPAGNILMLMLVLGAGALLLTYIFSAMLPFSFGVAVIAMYIPIGVLRFRKDRRIAAFNAALPDCIEMCARALRAGHSMAAAIDIVADQAVEPAKTEFGEVFKKQNYGLPLRDAFQQMLDRVPSRDLQVLVTGVLVQKDTGGNLAEIMDRIAAVIRDRIRIQREIRTHTAQGRMTGWILFLLPVAMLLLINLMNPGYSSVLFHTAIGKKMLYTGIALLLTGGLIIRHIIHGIEV